MLDHISHRYTTESFDNNSEYHLNDTVNDSTCNCSTHEDEFISSDSVQSVPEINNGVTGLFNNFCERLSEIFDLFSPLLSFAKNLIGENGTSQPQDSRQLIENFDNLLQNTKVRAMGQHLISRESQEALDELASTVSQLQGNNTNVDLGRVIADWRRTRDAQHLLDMADHIHSGTCPSLNEQQELREAFISGLRSLARAIRDAEERGELHAAEHLRNAADPLVSGVERAHEASQREETRLTYEDRRFMGERLEESCCHVDEGIRSGVFNGLDHSVLNELNNWTNSVYNFLTEFFERIEKEREEEEKAEKEEQCKKRCEEKEEIKFLHALHKRAENEKLRFLSIMKKAMMEAKIAFGIAKAELNNVVVNRARHNMAIYRAEREHDNSLYAESMYKRQAGLETYFETSEESLAENMPPPSVCEHESPFGFIFDVHC